LLENRTAVVLNEPRRTFLQASLTARMRGLGIGDYHSYYRHVPGGPRDAVEWGTRLDRLTAHETRFLPHPPSFELLERYLGERLRRESKPRPCALMPGRLSSDEDIYAIEKYAKLVLPSLDWKDSCAVTVM
ncbi:hypothetical protein Q2374_29095, partial [Escherichia coli]|nr:hypothetical protein [Escherichia coli]